VKQTKFIALIISFVARWHEKPVSTFSDHALQDGTMLRAHLLITVIAPRNVP
jgi:hypothetical protein